MIAPAAEPTRPVSDAKTSAACAICGDAAHGSYGGKEGERMKRDGLCFHCAFWELRAEQKNETVIDHYVYGPGSDTSEPSRWRGMSGRRFDIEYFDGRKITTFDLWGGGEIPERWRARIPNTARFLNHATRAKVGDITCFDQSTGDAPCFPLPNGRPVPDHLDPAKRKVQP